MRDDKEIPNYCTGEVWPKGEDQDERLAYDKDAAVMNWRQWSRLLPPNE